MRKVYKISILCIMAFVMWIVNGVEVKAASKEELKQLWYETNDYPIDVRDEEWYDFGIKDMFDILNPPQELINDYSSQKLADLMMNHPYLWVLPSYEIDNRNWFFDYISESTIYKELLERKDGKKCLLESYRNTDISIELLNSDQQIIWKLNKSVNAEIFGCQFINYYEDSFEEEERILAKQIKEEKTDLYSELEYDLTKQYLSFDINRNDKSTEFKNYLDNLIGTIRSSYGFTALSSPVPKSIENMTFYFIPGTFHKYSVYSDCYKWYDSEGNNYDPTTVQNLDGSVAYPWTLIGHSTPKYNCHSFAWIQRNINNEFWLDSPAAYITSSEVNQVVNGGNATIQEGDIIVYLDDTTNAMNHSAVVISTPPGATGIYVRSKIAGKALYDSPLDEVGWYHHSHNNFIVYR